jgi:hypothetical protein
MENDQLLKRKFTFRLGDEKLVLIKKPVESQRHVVMKALLWALYLPEYPDLQVEVPIGNKYKPDLVQAGPGDPRFWGEAGRIGSEKLRRILKRYSRTHFALAVWGADLAILTDRVLRKIRRLGRPAPVDLIRFPTDADRRFIDAGGRIVIRHEDLDWRQLNGP